MQRRVLTEAGETDGGLAIALRTLLTGGGTCTIPCMKRTPSLPLLLTFVWCALLALACNLTGSSAPPTIVPRPSATPLPTIGYATLSPQELPQDATQMPAQNESQVANMLRDVDSDRLFLHVDTLQNFRTRHVNSPYNLPDQGIGATYNYVLGQFQAIQERSQGRLFVFPHQFNVQWAGVTSTASNVAAVIQGTEVGAGVILIGAHYDSTSIDFEDGTAFAPGANDNASGVAALIELARIMSERQHRATLMFVAFSAEEIGRKGSIAFVNDYIVAQQIPLTAMINMDIIGSSTGPSGNVNERQIRIFSEGPNESRSRQLARAANLLAFNLAPGALEIVVQDLVDRPDRYGDHMSFSERGYPAVRFIEALEDPNRQHSERDRIEDVQASYLKAATQTIMAVVGGMADGPLPPTNISLRDNGNGTRTLVWEAVPGATSYLVALRWPGSLIYDQQFEVTSSSVTWDGFTPDRFAGLAIVAKDVRGLMGMPSAEYLIAN